MRRLFIVLSLLAFTISIVAEKVEFDFSGPDGNELKYRIENETSVSVIWRTKRYGKPYEYEHVVIPEKVTYKGKEYEVRYIYDAFYKCEKLKSIDIPKTIKIIDYESFTNCYELEKVNIHDIGAWCKIDFGDNPLRNNRAQLYLNNTLVESITFPNTLNSIEHSAFDWCKSLREIVIPSSVKKIGNFAFQRCHKLTSVKILDSGPVEVGKDFYHFVAATRNNGLKSIGESAFASCDSLTTVILPNSITTIGKGAFSSDRSLTNITLPSSLTELPEYIFRNTSLESITIPSSVSRIKWRAFGDCKKLKEVNIKNHSITIDNHAFGGCTNLSKLKGLTRKSKVSANAFIDQDLADYTRTPFSLEENKKTFSYFVGGMVEDAIAQWQKKGEFETSEQWKQRVTTVNRDKEVKRVVEQLRQEYIAQMTISDPKPTLLTYDADKGVQPVKIGSETLYVKVPVGEAQQFKTNFKPEYIHTDYDIADDRLAVVGRTCKIGDKTYQTTNTYAKADNLYDLAINLPPLEMDFSNNSDISPNKEIAHNIKIDRTIDQNIPASGVINARTFAVIIGNENYSLVAKVPFAKNDAQVFAEYCRKTLGLPDKNVRTYGDATFGMMKNAIKDIQNISNAYSGNINVIFYYAGHGIPNEQSKDAFLLPVDADGRETEICYPVSRLYQELGGLNAQRVVVLMDACFSGAQRGDGMLASARSVALKPKPSTPQGKMVVLSAATSDETAYPYKEKGHGMFTYFLLKKLRDTKGGCTLKELGDYIQQNVIQQSVVVNRKKQTPTVIPSQAVINSWQTMKLR